MNTTPRYILFTLLVLALAGAQGAYAQGGLGVTAGLNFNKVGDIEVGSSEATFDNATGWHVGLWFDLPLGPVSIRPGIRYMDAGSLFETEDTIIGEVPGIVDASVNLIEVPIDVRFRFGTPLISPYVLAGPVLRFPSGQEDEFELESVSYAASLGIGLEVGFGGLRVFPELKYTFGISRFAKEFELAGQPFEPDDSGQLNTIMLSLGIGL